MASYTALTRHSEGRKEEAKKKKRRTAHFSKHYSCASPHPKKKKKIKKNSLKSPQKEILTRSQVNTGKNTDQNRNRK